MDRFQARTDKDLTVSEVVAGLREWERVHSPLDRVTKLPLFQYVVEEAIQQGQGGALMATSPGPVVNGSTVRMPALVALAAQPGQRAALPAVYLREHAFKQLCSRLDYPAKLYDRLPTKLNILAINWLIQHGAYDRNVTVRLMDGNQARALMSQDFQPLDNLELLTLMEPYLGDAVVRWHYSDDMTFHMSVSYPKTVEEVKVGEPVEQGIHISNSEVGVRSVTVAGFVYVLRCKNGAISGGDGGDIYRFRHTGDRDKLRQVVEAAVESTKLEATRVIAQFKQAVQTKIDEPFQYLENVAKENQLTKEQLKATLDALLGDPEDKDNLWGVSQAISTAAQKFDGETAFEMKKLAVKVTAKTLPAGK